MARYSVLLKHGHVVDPASGRDGVMDVAVAGEKIAVVEPDIDPALADQLFDVRGRHVVPGIIDLHMHASQWLGGKWAHKMMAQVGVTSALDMSGPAESVLAMARDHGVGLNIACLEAVRPGLTVADADPGREELESLLDTALAGGALGLKLLGGHYPLTPGAAARAIQAANRRGAYVAFHAGTTERGSNIDGFLQAVELAGSGALHVAHVNSYCRGGVRPYMQETEEVLAALEAHPNLRAESYLSPMNGTSGKCSNGVPESRVTRECLQRGGFPPTEAGFAEAILAGWAHINCEAGGAVVLSTGKAAREVWRSRGTDAAVSFPVNPAEPRLRLATARRGAGGFAVDCLSTDGGGIPRNVIAEMGLALVALQALSLSEFVRKASLNPARILGLRAKGHFGPEADADITVLDLPGRRAVLSLANGEVIMLDGYACGRGGKCITTAAGVQAAKDHGLPPLVVDVATSGFYAQEVLAR
jgi:cytosine/adenosine deaminase-related metal-dependent hydrolase